MSVDGTAHWQLLRNKDAGSSESKTKTLKGRRDRRDQDKTTRKYSRIFKKSVPCDLDMIIFLGGLQSALVSAESPEAGR